MRTEKLQVTWIDARSSSGVKAVDELLNFRPVVIETVGFGQEFEDRVCLANDRWVLGVGTESEELVRDIQSIPRECIKSVKRLR